MVLSRATIPAPFVVAPTDSFDGDDGSWSTFAFAIGSPPQSFRILPATGGQEIWIPSTEGCGGFLSAVSDCGNRRGINDFQNAPSRGFMYNESSSWDQLNLYQLGAEQNLFPGNSALYGLDNVSLAQSTSDNFNTNIQDQTIAALVTTDFWLGSVGLGTIPGQFSGHSGAIPTLLVSMKNQSLVPSLSYGYTAGQSYASPQQPGSLVLGGFDATRISMDTSKSITIPLNTSTITQALQVGLQSILVTQSLQASAQQLSPNPLNVTIDSAVSQLWLPPSVCQLFSEAFGLTYDSTTDLYLVNDTIHSQLKLDNPILMFTIGGEYQDQTINIKMQYNAFDMSVGIPYYNGSSNSYFPIRNATNENQYVLGRTFLQEAYVVVDWERGNFTIGQALTSTSQDIRAILPLSATSSSSSPTTSTSAAAHTETSAAPKTKHGISSGAIAGIVVAVLLVFGIGLGIFLFMRRRKRAHTAPAELEARSVAPPPDYPSEKTPEKKGDHVHSTEAPIYEMQGTSTFHPPSELASTPRNEIDRMAFESELMGTPIMEMVGSEAGSELDVSTLGSRPQSPRMNSDLRHSRYLSIDGSNSMRLAELSSDVESDFEVSELGSRPTSPRLNSDRSRYISVNGAVSGPLLEEVEAADARLEQRGTPIAPDAIKSPQPVHAESNIATSPGEATSIAEGLEQGVSRGLDRQGDATGPSPPVNTAPSHVTGPSEAADMSGALEHQHLKKETDEAGGKDSKFNDVDELRPI